jgi:hypothetical protein
MNYHIEGVFHAEETMTKKDWYIWSDLTMKEIEGVKGIVKVTRNRRGEGNSKGYTVLYSDVSCCQH